MKQKGFAPILILILLVLVAGGAYYFGTKNKTTPVIPISTPVTSVQSSPSPAVQTVIDPVTGWKKYENPKYKYSFSFPSNFNLSAESVDHLSINNNLPPDPNCKVGGCFLGTQKLQIYFDSSSQNYLSFDEYAKKQRDFALNINNDQSEIVQISKFGTKVKYFEGSTEGYNNNYLFNLNDINFSITVVFPSKQDVPIYRSEADQILSTFQFTK
jgi:hypothetical protein